MVGFVVLWIIKYLPGRYQPQVRVPLSLALSVVTSSFKVGASRASIFFVIASIGAIFDCDPLALHLLISTIGTRLFCLVGD